MQVLLSLHIPFWRPITDEKTEVLRGTSFQRAKVSGQAKIPDLGLCLLDTETWVAKRIYFDLGPSRTLDTQTKAPYLETA